MRTDFCKPRLAHCLLVFAAGLLILSNSANATDPPGAKQPEIKDFFNQGEGGLGTFQTVEAKLTTTLTPADSRRGEIVTLSVKIELPPGYYTYPQKVPSGSKTTIRFKNVVGLEPVDKAFTPTKPAKVVFDEILKEDIHKHVGGATWTRQYRVTAPSDVKQITASGTINYQMCNEQVCQPPKTVAISTMAVVGDGPARKAHSSPKESVGTAKNKTSEAKIEKHPFDHEETPARRNGKPEPVTLRFELSPDNAKPGEEVTLRVSIKLKPGWHAFALSQNRKNTGLPTKIELRGMLGLEPADSTYKADKPFKSELTFEKKEQRTYYDSVTWSRRFRVLPDVNDHEYGLRGSIRYQVCDERQCRTPPRFSFALGHVPPPSATPIAEPVIEFGPESSADGAEKSDDSSESRVADGSPDKSKGMLPFLIAAVIAGFAAVLTPCVFPMLPITVSFFLKQTEEKNQSPVVLASVYCLGIIGTFTAIGLIIAAIFGAAAINLLANDPWLNLFFAGVLVFFAMNLLGMFEIRVPAWLLTWSSGKEAKGGIVGVLFMAFTFTLVSFTCTFAFVGGLVALAAKGEFYWPIIGMLAFSAAFSLPFFFLALFPSLLKKLPSSGGWMNTIKVTMGMIECALSFKFLSVADLSWFPAPVLFDYATVMTAWLVISACTGLYLLGMFRLTHDTPSESISAVRLAFAMAFLSFAGFLGVGLYSSEKPTGLAWEQVEAFAPPRFTGGKGDVGPTIKHHGLEFALDYEQALKYAEKNNLPVFFDFTGVNCLNCRKMEIVMARPNLKRRLSKFVLVQIYCDNVPTITDREKRLSLRDKNIELQANWLGDATLPSYAIVNSNKKLLARSLGLQDEATFAAFLDRGLNKWQAANRQPSAASLASK